MKPVVISVGGIRGDFYSLPFPLLCIIENSEYTVPWLEFGSTVTQLGCESQSNRSGTVI